MSDADTDAAAVIEFGMLMDSSAADSNAGTRTKPLAANISTMFQHEQVFTPNAGSHLFSPSWDTNAGTLSMSLTATRPLWVEIEEIGPTPANNTTSTG